MADGGGTDLVAELKKAIEESGLSLSELARRGDINPSQLSRFMRGERLLALDVASRLLGPLGLRIIKADCKEEESTLAPPKKSPARKPKK
jgi:transcriptional regulator with XRE-family HTH domain